MNKITTILFDFDGVITNTEPQYDVFFDNMAEEYGLGIKNFAFQVKGVTMPNILEKYFSGFSDEDIETIKQKTKDFEINMDFQFIPGVEKFIYYLKENGYRIGLVTSSQNYKMEVALKKMNLVGVFDTEVTANRITAGKPDPMCYLLGAKDLNSDPSECIVFEDSFSGIQAGTSAGMRVVGVATTIPANELTDKVYAVISDFTDLPRLLSFFE